MKNHWFKFDYPALLISFMGALVVYFKITGFDFLTGWDDDQYITENGLLKLNFFSFFTEAFTSFQIGNWHPLTVIAFKLQNMVSDGNPEIFRWTSIFLYGSCIYLVSRIAHLLFNNKFITTSSYLLFLFHPSHVESVAWISEQKDLLYGMFFLAGIRIYINNIKQDKTAVSKGVYLCFALSLLSKPAAVVFPLTLLVIDVLLNRKLNWKSLFEKSALFIMSMVVGLINIQAQKSGEAFQNMGFSIFQNFMLVFKSLGFYFIEALFPFQLNPLHLYPVLSEPQNFSLYYWLLIPCFIVFSLWFCRKNNVILGFYLFFLVNLILILKYSPVGYAIQADRYLFIPSVALCILLPWSLIMLRKKLKLRYNSKMPHTIVALMCIWYLYSTWNYIPKWKNGVNLFSEVIKQQPKHFQGYYIRGNMYNYAKQPKKAFADYSKSIDLNPEFANSYFNRGLLFEQMNQTQKAFEDYIRCIENDSTHSKAYYNRAVSKEKLNLSEGVMEDYNKAIELFEDYVPAYNNRGNLKLKMKDYKGALDDYSKSVSIDSTFNLAWFNMGVASFYDQNNDDACSYWMKAHELKYPQAKKMLENYCTK